MVIAFFGEGQPEWTAPAHLVPRLASAHEDGVIWEGSSPDGPSRLQLKKARRPSRSASSLATATRRRRSHS
eukprot:8839648-Pyramimonas_sp.AAC.1